MNGEKHPIDATTSPEADHREATSAAPKDSFLESMTFAASNSVLLNCDCDECGAVSSVPESIRAAVHEHKRVKRETGPIKRTQVRRLIQRRDGVAVWEWTLPPAAEPLLEFGNASVYRIIWLQRLRGCILKSIGAGIIGSRSEEKGRKILDWLEGDVFLVPSNEGKAIGWITEAMNTNDAHGKGIAPTGPAVLYVAKVPVVNLDEEESHREDADEDHSRRQCFQTIQSICARSVQARDISHGNLPSSSFKLENTDAELFRRTVSTFL